MFEGQDLSTLLTSRNSKTGNLEPTPTEESSNDIDVLLGPELLCHDEQSNAERNSDTHEAVFLRLHALKGRLSTTVQPPSADEAVQVFLDTLRFGR
jgi:hypothetical protein